MGGRVVDLPVRGERPGSLPLARTAAGKPKTFRNVRRPAGGI